MPPAPTSQPLPMYSYQHKAAETAWNDPPIVQEKQKPVQNVSETIQAIFFHLAISCVFPSSFLFRANFLGTFKSVNHRQAISLSEIAGTDSQLVVIDISVIIDENLVNICFYFEDILILCANNFYCKNCYPSSSSFLFKNLNPL